MINVVVLGKHGGVIERLSHFFLARKIQLHHYDSDKVFLQKIRDQKFFLSLKLIAVHIESFDFDCTEVVKDVRFRNTVTIGPHIIALSDRDDAKLRRKYIDLGFDTCIYSNDNFDDIINQIISQINIQTRYAQKNVDQSAEEYLKDNIEELKNDLKINTILKNISYQSVDLNLTQLEYKIIENLLYYKNRVVPKKLICKNVYGFDDNAAELSLKTSIMRIRKKINNFDTPPFEIVTHYGGYIQLSTSS
jgi:DNA-binding response OmpR family regulator